jgi:epoxyqueuosine reductase
MNLDSNIIKQKIIDFSKSIGIDAIGITKAEIMLELRDYLLEHKQQGYESGWEEDNIDNRINPHLHMAEAKSVFVIAISYQSHESEVIKADSKRGRIAKVSWGQDYHKLLHNKLNLLKQFIVTNIDENSTNIAFVDTGPLVDRAIAAKAGIGFYGYNCNVINQRLGSYIFIGSLLTSLDLSPDSAEMMECMKCNKCIEACPTQAIIAPYKINSKRCLAYLTLTKGEAGNEYQKNLTDQVYGCDVCQQVCPHNSNVPNNSHQELNEIDDVKYPDLIELLTISNKDFQKKYGHTSGVWRGKKPWQRNALLLIGQRKLFEAIPQVTFISENDPREDMRDLAACILKQLHT